MFSFVVSLAGGRRDSGQGRSTLPLLFSSVVASLRTCKVPSWHAFGLLISATCGVLCWQVTRPWSLLSLAGSRASRLSTDNSPVNQEHHCTTSPSCLSGKQLHRGCILHSGMCRGLQSSCLPAKRKVTLRYREIKKN